MVYHEYDTPHPWTLASSHEDITLACGHTRRADLAVAKAAKARTQDVYCHTCQTYQPCTEGNTP